MTNIMEASRYVYEEIIPAARKLALDPSTELGKSMHEMWPADLFDNRHKTFDNN